MKRILIILSIHLIFQSFSFSQIGYLIETGSSLGQGSSRINAGFNYSFASGTTIDKSVNAKFGYGLSDNLDIKASFQRLLDTEANVIMAVPKFSFGSFSVTPGIGAFMFSGNSELFLNGIIAYDYSISDDISSTFGINYNALFDAFGDGKLGAYASTQKKFGQIGLKIFYHNTFQDPSLNNVGLQLFLDLGESSSGGNSKKSSDDDFWK